MIQTLNLQRYTLPLGIPLCLIGFIILFVQSKMFHANTDMLSVAVTFDLLLTVPFIYFLCIRKTNIPKITIISLLLAMIALASFLFPSENQQTLKLFELWILPIIELAVIIYIVYRARKTIKKYKLNKEATPDFYTALKNTCDEILPKALVTPVVCELAVYYYGFFHWKKVVLKENEFSYHKENSTYLFLMVAIFFIPVETLIFHILLGLWSETLAWIVTIFSIYSIVQIFGFVKSIKKRPISITKNTVNLYYGVLSEVSIPLQDIDTIELSSKTIAYNSQTIKLSPGEKIEDHNIVIHLNKENTLVRYFGFKNTFKTLILHIDKKDEFKMQLEKAIQDNKSNF